MADDDDTDDKDPVGEPPEAPSPKAAGGRARAASLTAKKRQEIAKKAAAARWRPIMPTAEYEGRLKVFDIPCAVLDDGRRVLSQNGVGRALGREKSGKLTKSGRDGGGDLIPFFIAGETLKPFISEDLRVVITKPIRYRGSGGETHGVDATVLPRICEVWLKARDEGALTRPAQILIAQKAEMLIRAFADVGVVALVDEATGYQGVRPKDALNAYLEKILRKDLAAWSKTFPDEFYENIYKLKGWVWPGMQVNRYSVVAHYTRDLVYERLAPGLLKELEVRSPTNEKGERPNKLFQWLSDEIGNPMLSQHLYSLIMFQRLAISNGHGWKRFVRMVDQVHPKKGQNLLLPKVEDPTDPTAP
jgi:hypothetical protein